MVASPFSLLFLFLIPVVTVQLSRVFSITVLYPSEPLTRFYLGVHSRVAS